MIGQEATQQEYEHAAGIAQDVIRGVEGRRGVVLGEVLGILGAFYIAQRRLAGDHDPQAELRRLFESVQECAAYYDEVGLVGLGH